MSEKNTVARPYAKAAFEVALEHKAFQQWSDMLYTAAAMVENDEFLRLIKNPKFADESCAKWILELGEDCFKSQPEGQAFIRMLTENKRLEFLPEIAEMFEAYRKEAEKTVDAQVVSARPLDDHYKLKIQQALMNRLKVIKVQLHCEVDEKLISGALIRFGDMVIDGTARGRLRRIEEALGI